MQECWLAMAELTILAPCLCLQATLGVILSLPSRTTKLYLQKQRSQELACEHCSDANSLTSVSCSLLSETLQKKKRGLIFLWKYKKPQPSKTDYCFANSALHMKILLWQVCLSEWFSICDSTSSPGADTQPTLWASCGRHSSCTPGVLPKARHWNGFRRWWDSCLWSCWCDKDGGNMHVTWLGVNEWTCCTNRNPVRSDSNMTEVTLIHRWFI